LFLESVKKELGAAASAAFERLAAVSAGSD
jgi:hypothetical protein